MKIFGNKSAVSCWCIICSRCCLLALVEPPKSQWFIIFQMNTARLPGLASSHHLWWWLETWSSSPRILGCFGTRHDRFLTILGSTPWKSQEHVCVYIHMYIYIYIYVQGFPIATNSRQQFSDWRICHSQLNRPHGVRTFWSALSGECQGPCRWLWLRASQGRLGNCLGFVCVYVYIYYICICVLYIYVWYYIYIYKLFTFTYIYIYMYGIIYIYTNYSHLHIYIYTVYIYISIYLYTFIFMCTHT